MRRLRLALALGLALLALLVVAAAVAALALSRGWQRERLRAAAEGALAEAVGAELPRARVTLGALEGPLLPSLTLRGLAVEAGPATHLRVETLALRIDPWRLWREGVLAIEDARAEGVDLALDIDEARAALPSAADGGAPAPARAALPFALELARAALRDARFAFAWQQAGTLSRVVGRLDASLAALGVARDGAASWPERARIELALEPSSIAGRALRAARLALALDGSHARLETASLESDFGRLDASGDADLAGWLDPAAAAALALRADVSALDLGVLLGRSELAGALAGAAEVRATRAAGAPLADSAFEGALRLDPSRLGGVRLERGALRGRFCAGAWSVDEATLDASFARLRAHGAGSRERAESLDVELALSDLSAPARLLGYDAAGAGRLHVQARGAWRALQGALALEATRIRVEGAELGALRARASGSGDGRIRVETLALDGPRLRVANDGEIRLRLGRSGVELEGARLATPDGDAVELSGGLSVGDARRLRLRAHELALSRLAPLLDAPSALDGALDLDLVADGAWPRPALTGSLAWRPGTSLQPTVESVRLEVATRGHELRAQGAITAQGEERFLAELYLPWRPDVDPSRWLERPETWFEARSDALDLALLQPFLPDDLRRAQGGASLRVSLRGGAPEPELAGEAEIDDGFVYAVALGRKLGPISGRARLSREGIAVEGLRIGAGQIGVARAEGEILLDALRPAGVDLRVSLEKFPMRVNDVVRARLDGTIEVVGAFEALSASGALTLNDLRYTVVRQPDPLLAEITVHDGRAPAPAPKPAANAALLDGASLDLRLAVPAGELSGQGAKVAFAGELRAHKSPERPLRLSGRLDASGGEYRLRGKTFVLENGRATFTARPDFDPDLDALALYRVRDVKIFAHIFGRASSPVLRLESDPPYPEGDVLALLLFGRTRDELGQGQAGAVQSALGGAAGGAALGELLGPLPIDAFEVETPESGAPTIGVGRYVTEDVYVRFGQGFGTTGESEVRVDWRVSPRWNVQSTVSGTGSSVDVIWSLDY